MANKRPRVVVYGDSMLDVSIRSPEKGFKTTQEDHAVKVYPMPKSFPDGESLRPKGHSVTLGGAANLAANLSAMGCDVTLSAPMPQASDPWFKSFDYLCREHKVGLHHGGTLDCMTVKYRYYDGGRLVARVDQDGWCQSPNGYSRDAAILEVDAVAITDYNKGAIRWYDPQVYHRDVPIYVDPYLGKEAKWALAQINTLVLNAAEFDSLCKSGSWYLRGYDDRDGKSIDYHVLEQMEVGALAVKCGKDGSRVSSKPPRKGHHLIPAIYPTAVFDVQGAGDTYLAAFVAAQVRGLGYQDSGLFASAAAGVAVGRPGTAVVSLKEAAAALKSRVLAERTTCVSNLRDAAETSQRLKKLGFRVGYTNGCFDLRLHAGHRFTLSESVRGCDFLFVGVDSDARVHRLKGLGRPVLSWFERCEMVRAIAGVYSVFAFDEEPGSVVEKLQPDVVFKGGDYTIETMPEAASLKSYGGQLCLLGSVGEIPSTTEMLKEIRDGRRG